MYTYTKTQADILEMLRGQWHLNIAVFYHSSVPERKRIFVIRQLTPASGLVPYHDIKGQEVTPYIIEDFFAQQMAYKDISQNAAAGKVLGSSSFDKVLDQVPAGHYQLSGDFSYELYLSE